MPGSGGKRGQGVRGFFGWRVVGAAFVLAMFGWGMGFYGPPAFLHAVEAGRGWPLPIVSAAVTFHFLAGAAVVAVLPRLHRRFGLVVATRAGACASALGVLGWALAAEPWQLFVAAAVSGSGWAAMGAAALNAIVSPWFARGRPAALGAAFNGASMGGVLLSPLWVALIGWLGFPAAAGIVGTVMVGAVWWLSARYFGRMPAEMGLAPDGEPVGAAPTPRQEMAGLGAAGRDRRLVTLVLANALALFAQLGFLTHLVSVLAPMLGAVGAGLASGMATACAMGGRIVMARVLRPGVDRRTVAAANYALQSAGVATFILAGAEPVLLLLGVALFGLGLGNATSLPPLIAQQDFSEADVARVVALVVATGQGVYAFAPAAFGFLREADPAAAFAAAILCQLLAAIAALAGRGVRTGARC
jgi:MFS family permease